MAEDIRRRRADRVRQDRVKNFLPRYGKHILIAVVLIAAVGAAATFYNPPPVKKFAHEHASFALYIQGEQVSFADRAYDISAISDKVHMHIGESGGGSIWHIEASFPAGVPDVSLSHIFAQYGVIMRPGYLKLDTHDGHNGSEWNDAGNMTWKVYLSRLNAEGRGAYEPITGDYGALIPRDGDKLLVTYGDPTPEQLTSQQASIPDPPASGGPPPPAHQNLPR